MKGAEVWDAVYLDFLISALYLANSSCASLHWSDLERFTHVCRRQDIITLVTEASDHALQGADDAVAHILPELQLRKVIPRNQR